MNIHPQIILKDSVPEFVVLPYQEYKDLLDVAEKQEDINAIKEFQAGNQLTIPLSIIQHITDGEHPVRALRKWRKIPQTKLANETGITRQYLCQIENKQRKGNAKVLKKIASILQVDVDLLII
ncbi:MAG: helix-turn-helix transcriptional regulator [Gammaproteobacteria bacterium]|nr:helix-turn-helix transcriptional regulator [Gammaproteobacteria bacterium]